MTSVDPFFKLLTAGVSFDKRTSLDHSKLQKESNRVSHPSSISPIPTDNMEEGHKDRIARQEKVNHFRKQNRIRVTGTDVRYVTVSIVQEFPASMYLLFSFVRR